MLPSLHPLANGSRGRRSGGRGQQSAEPRTPTAGGLCAPSTAPAVPSRKRLLLGLDGRHGLLRPAALNIEPIGVGGPEPLAFDLVAACEGLHLAALGLLIPEVDRAKRALAADRAGSRVGLATAPPYNVGTRSVGLSGRARNAVRERSPPAPDPT